MQTRLLSNGGSDGGNAVDGGSLGSMAAGIRQSEYIEACSSGGSSNASTISSTSSSSKCLSKFSSPFKRKSKGLSRKSKEETFEILLLSTSEDESASISASANSTTSVQKGEFKF